MTSYGVDASYRPEAGWRFDLSGSTYHEDRDRPDAAAISWDQVRLSARFSFLIGSSADRLPLPRAVRGARHDRAFAHGARRRRPAAGRCGWRIADARPSGPAFDHDEHVGLFPGSCTTCHLGAAEEGSAIWPTAANCATCHDGTVEAVVEWAPPTSSPPTNLRFAHASHRRETRDSVPCATCHQPDGPRGAVTRGRAEDCVDCHEPGVPHLAATDRECARCHVPLAQAVALPEARIAAFPAPPSHDSAEFAFAGHGRLATASRGGRRPQPVSASCSTCHAREFCLLCHVNAPEVAAIQALAPDRRSLLLHAELEAPASHGAATFVTAHGGAADRAGATCATCHTQPSCTACHVAPAPGRCGRCRCREPDAPRAPSSPVRHRSVTPPRSARDTAPTRRRNRRPARPATSAPSA
ncbi:MAG: cytochrome c3 family protein [Gemmatimonadales bacterium]|nr:cytochrome c3 family protein [Gemmatimonadales bacterium]